tara:strand:- start:20295 stop:21092 length:798 start_codon:yes stop_codon:yes gene_type:complete
MLQSSKDLITYKAKASNGEIVGRVRDLLFDDASWTVRYLVVDTGSWLVGRKTLVAISQCWEPDTESKSLQVNLSKEQIENGPSLDEHAPVSRQFEIEFARHFQLVPYWGGLTGPVISPALVQPVAAQVPENEGDPSLRSMSEVMGYSISAQDENFGEVEELVVDDIGWIIRYLVVDTRKWLPSPKVLIAPEWALKVSRAERAVSIDLTKSEIRSAPDYDRDSLLLRDYEDALHRHYGREGYWESKARAERIEETSNASVIHPEAP